MNNPLIICFVLFSLTACASQSTEKPQDMQTVSDVDLNRYMGVWYEIGRFPHSFEKGLVGVTATYRLKDNGKVEVLNQGYKNTLDGKLKKAKGFAKVPDPNETGRLKVYFFWPFGGDYLILDLDKDYQWVLIGSNSKNYLWILSRTPQMPESEYQRLVEKARSLGYDTSRIELVEQKVQ